MEMIIQSSELYGKDNRVEITGYAKKHRECGKEMVLVVQAAPDPEYDVTTWWYCETCSETEKVELKRNVGAIN